MTKFTVKCTNISWSVEAEDVCVGDFANATDEELEEEIARIKNELPTKLELDVWGNETDDPWNLACDALSDEYGWLVEGFECELLEKENED